MKRLDDKRVFARMPVNMEVVELIGDERLPARALDLGELGMRYVTSARPSGPAREVELEFELPDGAGPLRVGGWIADELVVEDKRYTSVMFAYRTDGDAARVCQHVAWAMA